MFDQLKKTYRNKRVLVTGHTGFKGSWISLLLSQLGADVHGYALDPPTNPNLYTEAKIDKLIKSYYGDVRNYKDLLKAINEIKPEIIFHMAAQPLVRDSYLNPVETYEVNVMGTIKLFEAIRQTPGIKAIINITTDKCYENKEWHWGYREDDRLGGYDPYSNSKGCSELATQSFRDSFFNPKEYDRHGVSIATARAGNVIGGGDWGKDRLIPDIIQALSCKQEVILRNPNSIRPWQHVIEPLTGYLQLGTRLISDGPVFGEAWNFGPDVNDCKTVEWITDYICKKWGASASYNASRGTHLHEATFLKLDCSKAKAELGWQPKWNIAETLDRTVEWHKNRISGKDVQSLCSEDIKAYFNI